MVASQPAARERQGDIREELLSSVCLGVKAEDPFLCEGWHEP